MTPAARPEPVRVQSRGDQLIIPVACRHAEALQTRLRRQDIGTTLYLEPYTEEARLEVWPGVDAGRVQAALDDLSG
jgi:hypothetical protein